MTLFRITLLNLLIATSFTSADEPNKVVSEKVDHVKFARDISAFKSLRKKVGVPKQHLKEDAIKSGKKFALEEYFNIFQSLKMDQTQKLDWVYYKTELGGSPIIYSRPKPQKAYPNYEAFIAAVQDEAQINDVNALWEAYDQDRRKIMKATEGDRFKLQLPEGADLNQLEKEQERFRQEMEQLEKDLDQLEKDFELKLQKYPRREYRKWWMESIRTDHSAQGYLELGALYLLADQFALYWHSHYNDLEIIADRDSLTEVTSRNFGYSEEHKSVLPEDVVKKALLLDPTPQIQFKRKTVDVSLLTFTKWGGFIRHTLTISKTSPHKVISKKEHPEVGYESTLTY